MFLQFCSCHHYQQLLQLQVSDIFCLGGEIGGSTKQLGKLCIAEVVAPGGGGGCHIRCLTLVHVYWRSIKASYNLKEAMYLYRECKVGATCLQVATKGSHPRLIPLKCVATSSSSVLLVVRVAYLQGLIQRSWKPGISHPKQRNPLQSSLLIAKSISLGIQIEICITPPLHQFGNKILR